MSLWITTEQYGESLFHKWVSVILTIDLLLLTLSSGDLLVSTGDDASIRTWKKAVNGQWAEYAEIETARKN